MRSIDLLGYHLLGDFLIQTPEQARDKLEDPKVRAEHVTTYHAPFLIGGLLTGVRIPRLLAFLGLSWAAHFVTDSRRWAKTSEPFFVQVWVDQAIHVATLAALNRVAGRSRR